VKRSRYKYLSKVDHVHQFMAGEVYLQTLGYFRDYEDGASRQVIGDEFESTASVVRRTGFRSTT